MLEEHTNQNKEASTRATFLLFFLLNTCCLFGRKTFGTDIYHRANWKSGTTVQNSTSQSRGQRFWIEEKNKRAR